MRYALLAFLSLNACQLSAPGPAAAGGSSTVATPPASASAMPATTLTSGGPSVTLAGHTWKAEIEDTDAAREQGLSDRPSLDPDSAMVFTWGSPQQVQFWMHGMEFPLDVVFVQGGKVVSITAEAPPCPASGTCPTFGPDTPVDYVVEINAGQAAKYGVKDGVSASFTR
ncbi:MAG TPA: DUF192 domain-containing protein [Oscillatoriaceae cyanobacterium]